MTGSSRLRLLRLVALCVCLLGTAPAWAQIPGLPATAETPAATPAGGELEQLVKTLEDPQRRDRLLVDLKALLEAQREAREAEKKSEIGANIEEAVAGHTERVGEVFDRFVDWLGTFDQLPVWLAEQAEDPRRRAFWTDVGTILGLTLAGMIVARWLASLALHRPIQRLRNAAPVSIQSRMFLAVTLAVVEAFVVAVTVGAGYSTLLLLGGRETVEEGAVILVIAWAIQAGVGVIARFVLAPYAERLRPLPLRSETAAYLYVWVMRLTTVAVIGFLGSQLAVPFGAGKVGARGIEIGAALVFAILLVVLILQSREELAAVIRGPHERQVGDRLRRRIGDVWHVLALIYVLVAFGIFVSGEQDGFVFLVRATAVTLAALAVAAALARLARRLIERLFRVDDDLDRRFPGLRQRAGLYRPVLTRAVDVVIMIVAFAVTLSAWGLDLYTALGPAARGELLQSILVIALVVVIGVSLWEFASGAIQRALSGTYADGTPRQPSGRAKTLLPLLRRVISIALVGFGGLIVLSEIGVDTAPLLAGAGVIGLAIGFGSQALVRDVITGLFMLIEDTISVGDVVTAGGHSGVVEDISIRILRLRDLEGSVHTVPFGNVTSVTNMTKDFSFAVIDVRVARREDTDHVAAVICEVAAELQQDPEHGPKFLEPLEILGVDKIEESAVLIRARIKTKPIMQWGIKREMNRRLKKRFDADGIEIPFPHQTLYFGVGKDGSAAPARIMLEAERTAAVLEHKLATLPEGEYAAPPTVSAEAEDSQRAEREAREEERKEAERKQMERKEAERRTGG